jgi:hypothetical protein
MNQLDRWRPEYIDIIEDILDRGFSRQAILQRLDISDNTYATWCLMAFAACRLGVSRRDAWQCVTYMRDNPGKSLSEMLYALFPERLSK